MTEEELENAVTGSGEAERASEDARDSEFEARREFLAYMRHELRTPINHIVGYSEMLQEEAEDLGQEGFIPDLQRIHSAGQQLLSLTNEFFALDSLVPSEANGTKTGKMSVSRTRHEFRTPLNAIIGYSEMLQEQAEDLGHEDFIPDLQKICSAANQLLAVMNDSLAFSEVGAGEIASKQSTSGLSMMSREAVSAILSSEETTASKLPTEHGSLLVVDDNEMNRDMLSRRLDRQGHMVAGAENGRQALEMIQTNSFDLVLLDVMMPELNGYQVLERLKADDDLRHIPVIMLSALDELDSVVRCIELGAEDYLPKPFNPVLLRARVNACLEKKRLRDQEVFYLQQIEQEKKRADDLLHVILPEQIVEELKATNMVRPRRYENVAVLFCDIVGFTSYCDGRPPEEVMPGLQRLVEKYEELALRYNLEKIKTIGDSFMATAGLLKLVENPVLASVRCGLDMLSVAQQMPENWLVRVGINVGPVMAGVVGRSQYLFDLWGDTVNTAARIESNGMANSVNVSRVAWQQISDQCYGESLGMVQVKGKGELEILRVKGFIAD